MSTRIAVISEHASPLAGVGGVDGGGQNVYVAQTARELARSGFAVDVFTRRDDANVPAIAPMSRGVRVFHVDAGPPASVRKEELLPYMSQFARRVARVVRDARRDGQPYALAHAHFFMSGLVARHVKKTLGLPYVVTFHALGRVRLLHQAQDAFPPERGAIEQLVIDHADAIVAECPQDRADLQTHYRTPGSRVRMIPCGYDPVELGPTDRAAARRALGLPAHRPIILQLGRMVPRKGVDDVIRAAAIVRRRHGMRPLLLVVGGETRQPDVNATPEIGRLMRIAADEGIAEDVRFVGRRDRRELRRYYGAADVFVTMPWYEPFGITPVEAMACALPVVGARVGGVKYSVQDGRTGFLVAPRDTDALARRLAYLFSNPAVARLLGERGRERARQHFTWRSVAQSLADLYADVATTATPLPAPVTHALARG